MVDLRYKKFKVNEKVMNSREYAEWVRENSVKTKEELRKIVTKWLKGKKVTKEYIDKVVEDIMHDINEGLYITKDGKVYSEGELLDMEFGIEDTGIAELE